MNSLLGSLVGGLIGCAIGWSIVWLYGRAELRRWQRRLDDLDAWFVAELDKLERDWSRR